MWQGTNRSFTTLARWWKILAPNNISKPVRQIFRGYLRIHEGLQMLGATFGYAMAFEPAIGDYRVTFYRQNSGCAVVKSHNRSNLANSPRCAAITTMAKLNWFSDSVLGIFTYQLLLLLTSHSFSRWDIGLSASIKAGRETKLSCAPQVKKNWRLTGKWHKPARAHIIGLFSFLAEGRIFTAHCR